MRRFAIIALAAVAACEVIPKEKVRSDSAAAADSGTHTVTDSGAIAGARGAADSLSLGVPPAPSDSLRDSSVMGITPADSAAFGADSGRLRLFPEQPRRGDVVVALLAPGGAANAAASAPRCTWKGASIPCYDTTEGVRALIPLPADEEAGSFTLTIDGAGGAPVRRDIAVADREFGRELVFLDQQHYALVKRRADIARDARAVKRVLATASARQLWSGAWRDPVTATGKSSEYGIERFYYPAADSSRAITLSPEMHARGVFAADTSTDGKAGDVPSWRHAGIDIAARRGSAVRAPAAGVVADVADYILTGRTILLDHGQGVYTAYFHLDTAVVRRGDVVKPGA
ncbi:MAG TPA: M23 family metallopeptidase, partial [Gemmatimonadaceae bacterium]|nr:M23 family metallopeptidase [Gemmatimonadaceae bacterium]